MSYASTVAAFAVQTLTSTLLAMVIGLMTLYAVLLRWPQLTLRLERILPLERRHTRAVLSEFARWGASLSPGPSRRLWCRARSRSGLRAHADAACPRLGSLDGSFDSGAADRNRGGVDPGERLSATRRASVFGHSELGLGSARRLVYWRLCDSSASRRAPARGELAGSHCLHLGRGRDVRRSGAGHGAHSHVALFRHSHDLRTRPRRGLRGARESVAKMRAAPICLTVRHTHIARQPCSRIATGAKSWVALTAKFG